MNDRIEWRTAKDGRGTRSILEGFRVVATDIYPEDAERIVAAINRYEGLGQAARAALKRYQTQYGELCGGNVGRERDALKAALETPDA